jgi:putative ABC transport system permease protein
MEPVSLPAGAAALLRALLPHAERDEVLDDVAREYAERRRGAGPLAARVWLWRQVIGSVPSLLQRGWWRGWTGFEPHANGLRPGGPMFESWIMDARYACRRLVSRPAFTTVAVVTLALGAGGTAAVFSVVRALLLEPLPIAAEERVGVFWFEQSWTEQEITRLRPHFPGFDRVAGWKPGDMTLELEGEQVRLVPGVVVTAELFDVLGQTALLGRTFRTGDDERGAGPSVVLSHALWRDLGEDPAIVGRQLVLGGIPRLVRGVMPPGFWFPSPATRVWVAPALNAQRAVGEYTLIGRVGEGQPLGAMQAPLGQLATRLAAEFRYLPQWDKTKSPAITPVREFLLGDLRPPLVATFGAMALILLIACVNVTTLMLGQLGHRTTELATRIALGAGRDRLLQQLMVEALALGSVAGVAGAAAAAGGFGLLVRSLPLGALAETTTLDWRLFWTSLVVALSASVVIAVIVAITWWRGTLHGTLASTRTRGVSVRGGHFESGLVVGQVALAVVLAVGAGLLIRSTHKLRTIHPGADVGAVAVLDVTVPARTTIEERRRAYLAPLAALQALPGVRAAAVTQRLPLRGPGDNWSVRIAGRPDLDGQTTFMRIVSNGYFDAMGIDVRRGRGFLPTDGASRQPVVVVNEAFAAKFFSGADPLGQLLNAAPDYPGDRIVGVVENVAEGNLTDAAAPARYMLYEHVGGAVMSGATFVLRADDPAALPAVLQAARITLQRDGPQIAVNTLTTMQTVFDTAVGPTGRVVTLVSLLAALALMLGAVGIYGVMTHFVSRRLRDYGICMMLGLAPRQVLMKVVRRGAVIVAVGSVVGLTAAATLTRLLSSLLYQVAPLDFTAFAGAVLALLAVGTGAAFLPALRASFTDPAALLRQD